MNEVKMQEDFSEGSTEKKKHKRRLMSKYDSVKIYVWLPGEPPHSYVFSRYLLARMLTVAKIPQTKSVKIALNLKKHLVDQEQLNISQAELETFLSMQMQMKGFGNDYFERLKFVHRFFCEKRPLVISICGAPLTGKSTLAQQLASKCNLPIVLQTDLIYEMMKRKNNSPLPGQSFLDRPDVDESSLVVEYQRECSVVRQSLEAELNKILEEGKSIIMEGVHLDPGLYLSQFLQESHSSIVYIPVVVTANVEDHKLLAREALTSTGCHFFEAHATSSERESAFGRLRKFQEFLTEYKNEEIIQVDIGISGTEEALEKLHNHFLSSIQLSLGLQLV